MELEMLQTKPHLIKKNMVGKTLLNTFDLPFLVEKLKRSHSLVNRELNAMILLRSPKKQIVLTALHEGTEIVSFQSNDSITFQIIEGKLMFRIPKKTVILDKGQLLTLQEKIEYSLIASQETVSLLTIANGIL
jgi:hypothetical protein